MVEPAVGAVFASPIGPVHAAAIADGLVAAEVCSTDEAFAAGLRRRTGRALLRRDDALAEPEAVAHLDAFEAWLGGRFDQAAVADDFEGPVLFEGVSAWDRRVLEGVRAVGFGRTVGYGELARRIGAPGAARAVGSAVGRNPRGLVVPCHRVIAGDGTLGGYGGSWPADREALLALKERLLALEGIPVARRPRPY